ncbi:MAG: O-antigen ligase family protein [Planctomycetota bacterium]
MNAAGAMRVAGLAGIVGVAVVRAFVSIQAQTSFDVDPARDPMPLLSLGPAGSALFDALLALAAALALAGERMAGRGVHAWTVALAALPGVAVAAHAGDAEDLFRGLTWLSGMLAFVALAHLVRERRMRVAALAVLVGASAPLAARGAVQVTVEHAATVRAYEETRDAFLADRGWTPDSSAARTYERRLRQAEATGWFNLANPFSTVMGAGLVVLGFAAWRGWRKGEIALSAGVGAAALLSGALLVANGSKGALAATAIAGCVTAAVIARAPRGPRAAIAVGCAALVVAAVLARGALGTSLGELSLLFRGYYLEASAGMFLANPALGTGPAGVQEAFMQAKPARCPEDVTSVHSMFVDWTVALGALALAWCALVPACFRGRVEVDAEPARDGASVLALRIAGGAAAVGLVLQAFVEGPALDHAGLVLRAVGFALFIGVSACAARVLEALEGRVVAGIALGAATLVLMHCMIETTAWLPGSAVLALALLAAGSSLGGGGSSGWPARGAVLVAGIVAIAAGAQSLHARALESRLEAVADAVRPLAEVRSEFQSFAVVRGAGKSVDAAPLVESVRAAAAAAGSSRADEFAARLVTALRAEMVPEVVAVLLEVDGEVRRAAARELVAIDAAQGGIARSRVPLEAAIKQLAASGRRTFGARTAANADREAFDEACRLAEAQLAARPGVRSTAMRADLAMEELRANPAPDAARIALLEPFVRAASELQPFNARRMAERAEAAAQAGRPEEAIELYDRALALDAQASLDPLAQMSLRETALIRVAQERLRGDPAK